MKILITSGGTKVPIDRVRSITNMSSGNFGQKIAYECLKRGHEVLFFRAKGSKSPMSTTVDLMEGYSAGEFTNWFNDRVKYINQYTEVEYSTFDQYLDNLPDYIAKFNPDVVVLAAAVSDYGVYNYTDGKIRSGDSMTIKLRTLPKVISGITYAFPHIKVVGFKLLVDSTDAELIEAAEKSIRINQCDMVVANDLRDIKNSKHRVLLVKPDTKAQEFHTDPNDPYFLARTVVENIEKL